MVAAASSSPARPHSSRKQYRARCISLPARSHPVAIKIEEEINKLASWEASSSSSSNGERICWCLAGLGELYKCIGELFGLALTQEVVAGQQHENHWVSELLDGLLMYLDVCGSTRDVVSMIKQSVRELQSALRRSKAGGEQHLISNIEGDVNAYVCSRKKMKKEITKCLASLKQMEDTLTVGPSSGDRPLTSNGDHLGLVVKFLREASLITTSVFNSVLRFLAAPTSKPVIKSSRWLVLVSKLVVHSRVPAYSNEGHANELEDVDMAVVALQQQSSCKDGGTDGCAEMKNIESAQGKLEGLDGGIEGFEDALECLFRRLIQARASLLNIVSQ